MSFITLREVCRSTAWCVCLFVFVTGSSRAVGAAATEGLLPQKPSAIGKPRVIILSDFPPLDVIPGGAGHGPAEKRSDPDDVQSMVRFLVYANEFDVEGLVASAGTFANIARKQNILDILNLYDQVDENLLKHDSRYPTADRLREVTWQGRDGTWGKPANEIIGEGRDSEASEAIIKVVDGPDPRPVWVCVWGGPTDLSQAIWKVQKTRSPAELDRFLGKLRIFLIGLGNKPAQDGSGQWLLDNFPDLFVIVSQKTYGGMFAQKSPIGNLEWLNANIREGHGPLGAAYPRSGINPNSPGQQEGDTPSFLYLYSAVRGMNDPERPEQESWGGQYQQRDPARKHWYDGPGAKSVSKWLPDMQRDFATRMDWCVKEFKDANHAPVAKVNGALVRKVKPGETVKLAASATDPDGNRLTCKWWQYADADSARAIVAIANSDSLDNASFVVPNEPGQQVQVILEVTDHGTPPLVGYRRVTFNIQ